MRTTFVTLFIASSILCGPALLAQEGRGTIGGRIVDSTGARIPGAEVRVTNAATGVSVSGKANETGIYTIPYLLPGAYTLTAEFAGFKKTERAGIDVRVNDVLNIDVQLEIGSASESVQVSAATPLLETANASAGQVVDQRRIDELPLQAGNASQLTLLTPGVTNGTNLRARKTSFNSASSQFTTDGNAMYSNEYSIDGVPDTFATGGTPLVAFQPPQAAVSEFKVQTSAFDAASGHTSGAAINLITKSGTNEYHGEMHEWFANSALDAPTFFQNLSGGQKPVYQDNRFGAALGGPISIPKVYNGHNRTFFFYAWERNIWGKPTANVGTVPTDAEKTGDLSALLKLGPSYQIYDPLTTKDVGGGRFTRQPFAGNIIPPNRIDPVAQKIMAYYAEPNVQGTKEGKSNYIRNTADTFDYFVHFMRFDHNFSEKSRIFVRLDYDHYLENNSNFYNNIASGLLLTRINKGAAIDEVLVLTPNSILNLRYGLTQENTPERRRSSGFDVASLGFSPQLLSLLNPATATFPNVYLNTKALTSPCKGSCTGTFSGFGNFQDGDGATTGMIHNLAATMNWMRGNHNIRYGTDLRLYRSFGIHGGYDVSPGLQFLPTYTNGPNDNSAAAAIGQEFASFLLGIPSGQMTRSASYAMQNTFAGLFIQDDWKLTAKLTVNIGLRYEYESPVTERFDRAVRGFDFTDPNPIQAQALANYAKNPVSGIAVSDFKVLGGLMFAGPGNHSLWSQPATNFLPRFGLAYQLNEKTVFRGGYGIFYDTIGVNRTVLPQQGFTSSTPIIASYDNGLNYAATTANPFPNGLLPAAGASGGLTTYLGQGFSVYPTSRKQPYAQRWTFGIQRLLPGQILLDASYVGNKAIHLPVDRNINAIDPKYLSRLGTRDQSAIDFLGQLLPNPFYGINSIYPKTITRADLLRPYPEFGDISESDSIGYSWYHALQVRAEKRFAHGYTINAAYTWSKNMDATSFLNPGDPFLYRGISGNDRPQRLAVSGIYELPFGKGRMFGSSLPRVLDFAVGGWQLNGIFTLQSGAPLSFGDVILYSSDVALASDVRSVNRWFNTSAFETSTGKQLASHYRTFPKYLTGVRGPGQQDLDLSLIKYFNFTERWKLQFRAECFDCLNHVNFSDPNTTVTGTTFGTITAQASPSRQFQGALKLTF
jgi:hypothetical protein